MGEGTDKQFVPLRGHPLLAYTLSKFQQCPQINEMVIVIRPERRPDLQSLLKNYAIHKARYFADGGAERQDSVWNGLQSVRRETDIVLIHDGARPCITIDMIQRTLTVATEHGAAVVATKITDTIKEASEQLFVQRTVDRGRLWAVQTPQGFRLPWIRDGYTEVRRRGLIVTDDAAAVELTGKPIYLVENRLLNLKVTTPADLALAEWSLRDTCL